MPELVRDGKNGFLVASLDEAVVGGRRGAALDRAAVRASVEHRFEVERMVDDYLDVYSRVVSR